jgi:hypothetical protein
MGKRSCGHSHVDCINPYELIRKYRCKACSALMMCGCDEPIGRRFLAHQLREGTVLETQERMPVTRGFQPAVCAECRGLPIEATPLAEMHGATSKVKRYYWREVFFEEMRQKADWDEAHPEADDDTKQQAHRDIDKAVLATIKQQHLNCPKYVISEPSQSEILERCGLQPISITADHAVDGKKGAVVLDDGVAVSPEALVQKRYEAEGWLVMTLESLPFHALFGVMMWTLIEDPADTLNRFVQFGDRNAFEAKQSGVLVSMFLPSDFGSGGYGQRRKAAIKRHFKTLLPDREELLWLFDYWRGCSENLRQYLWAHRASDVDRARQLIEVLPPELIRRILLYLVENYWERYLGWPDLLLHRGEDIRMVEVKSSSDKLSGAQKRWIVDNHARLLIPFDLVKLHRPSGQTRASN